MSTSSPQKTIEAKTQIKSSTSEVNPSTTEDSPPSLGKGSSKVKLLFPKKGSKNPEKYNPNEEYDEFELDPRKQQWSESLKARLFGSADKDGNFFSFMFLDKIFGETRPCIHCGARGSAKLPPGDHPPLLFVIEEGIIGKQEILCEKCNGEEIVISGDDPTLLPQDPRVSIRGSEIQDYCKKITHYEVLHDLMEMLNIAAMDNGVARKEKHSDVAAFMLHNARKICEEWCRPEHTELRLRKYLRLREETLLTKYKPTFTPDCTEEFKEMYEMMGQSFRQNRSNVMILLQLLKESLIDNPSRSTFMMWTSIAMMHCENYPQFKQMYDPRSFMRVESMEYQNVQDNYLSLDVPLGIKKIPIIFVLFEIPRFYHYVNFLNQRLGKRKPRGFLTEREWEELKAIDEEEVKMGVGRAAKRRSKKTKTMVSPEAHLDFLTQQEEMDRERVYQSCREKKVLREDKEALQLGQDFDRKALPRPGTQKEAENTTPPGADSAETRTAEDKPLSKAQIKRRKKKAAALKTEKEESQSQNAVAEKVTDVVAKPKRQYSPLDILRLAGTDNEDLLPDWQQSQIMLSEQNKMEAVLMETMFKKSENPSMPESERVELIKDLSALSYPVVADLLDSVDTLIKPLEEFDPTQPKRVSVLLDPFYIYEDGRTDVTSGAIAFVKRKGLVREPLPIKPLNLEQIVCESPASPDPDSPSTFHSPYEKGQSRLAKLMADVIDEEVIEDEEEGTLDYAFTSVESTFFPKRLRDCIENSERDNEMFPLVLSTEDYREVMENTKKFGISHMDIRHHDTESMVLFPSRLEDSLLGRLYTSECEPQITAKATKKARSRGAEAFPNLKKPVSKVFLNPDSQFPRTRNIPRRGKKDAKPVKALKYNFADHHAVMVTQMDTQMLKRKGYKVDSSAEKSTVICNKDGSIIHVMDGKQTPDQVKDFLADRYNIIAQQTGPGYLSAPTKEHPRGMMVDAKSGVFSEISRNEKIPGNRKKMRGKKKEKVVQDRLANPFSVICPNLPPRNPHSEALGLWATKDGPWPEGLDYNTEYHYDREILCENDDEDLVKAIDKDEFGNHAMLMRLELTVVDAPNEAAAETVTRRYMEPADLGPGIDPKIPRFIIPSSPPDSSKKLPPGTTRDDIPLIMRFVAPHKQMRTLDAMSIPYKYELKQLLTPHLNEDGEEVPSAPKRIALLSKLTLLPRNRYKSLMKPGEVKEEEKKEEKKEAIKEREEEDEAAPKISKSQRKKMKLKMKKATNQDEDGPTPTSDSTPPDPSEEVRSKLDHPGPMQDQDEEMEQAKDSSSSTDETKRVMARSKFRCCDNCGQEIVTRILVCAGCKKVAYCNFRCQKASWKVHKKNCSYALRNDGKESTG